MLEFIFSWTTLWWVMLILYIPACLGLIGIVLLQKGKGVGFAGAFGAGGGTEAVFGPRTSRSLPQRITYTMAAVFMLFALVLSMLSGRIGRGAAPDVLEAGAVTSTTPAATEAPAAETPAGTVTTPEGITITPVVEGNTVTIPAADAAVEVPAEATDAAAMPAESTEAPAEEAAANDAAPVEEAASTTDASAEPASSEEAAAAEEAAPVESAPEADTAAPAAQ